MAEPTLVQWAGGPPALRALIEAFYDRVESDDLPPRSSWAASPRAPGARGDWWVEVFGGPATYTGERGGYEAMLAHHRGLGITPAQRQRSCR